MSGTNVTVDGADSSVATLTFIDPYADLLSPDFFANGLGTASTIAGSVAAADSSGLLVVQSSDENASSPLAVATGDIGEIEASSGLSSFTLPAGYTYFLDPLSTDLAFNAGPQSINVLAGSGGLSVTGGTGGGKIVTTGGTNVFNAAGQNGGNYLVEFGAGNDTVSLASGNNVVFAGDGKNVISTSGTGSNFIVSSTVSGDVIAGNGGTTTVLTQGSDDSIIGGTGTLIVDDSNSVSATVAGSSTGLTEIFAGDNETYNLGGAGSHAILVFGGSGGDEEHPATPNENDTVNAGAGAVTIFGGISNTGSDAPGNGAQIVNGGAGSLVFVAAADEVITIAGGSAPETLFGAANSSLSLTGSTGGNVLVANGGSETLSGAEATGGNAFFAGTGFTSITGGAGLDTIIGGSGFAYMEDGSGPTLYDFVDGLKGASTITGFDNGKDVLQLTGATSAGTTMTSTAGGLVVTLADDTKITLDGITSVSHIVYS